MADGTIRSDVVHLEQVRTWFGRPLREMEPADADAYIGTVLRAAANRTCGRSLMSTSITTTATARTGCCTRTRPPGVLFHPMRARIPVYYGGTDSAA